MNEMKEAAVRQFLLAIGDDPQRAGLVDTPGRVVKANAEIFAHTGEKHFANYKLFDVDTDAEMVVLADIPFYSMCEHHLLPFFGTATIAYLRDYFTDRALTKQEAEQPEISQGADAMANYAKGVQMESTEH